MVRGALTAALLTHRDVSPDLVQKVEGIIHREDFIKENRLKELFEGGLDFAQRHPEFAFHRGAVSYFDPKLHPFLDPEFVESTEGIRSFVVSVIIAAFFGWRWWRQRKSRRMEHRLDRHLRSLLDIERRQISLDVESGAKDLETLQKLLDDVTVLRQEALTEFSAHDLNEEPAAACFIDMCHELSQKINAKITRQRMEKHFSELAAALAAAHNPTRATEPDV